MLNKKFPDRTRVRLDLPTVLLNSASKEARARNRTLSQYLEGLVERDLGARRGATPTQQPAHPT